MKLFDQIETLVPSLGGWTSVPKAQTFSGLILAYRPMISVELGVWEGRGALSLALAHKEIGRGMVYAIDAWSPEASVQGQIQEADRKHWAAANHEAAYQIVMNKAKALEVQHCLTVIRKRSEDVDPPEGIGFLIVDGNHGETAIADVKRFAPKVLIGGFCYLDDLDWAGGAVRRAEAQLKSMGFRELYTIETGAMYQRQ
jgi:hypothetical protein